MKIGFLSMPLTGHLHPMTALGRKMQARGHEVTFFGLPDAARIVHSAGQVTRDNRPMQLSFNSSARISRR